MPLDLDHLSRLGASVRLQELEAELKAIRRFLGKAAQPPADRPKRTMSAAARKRISRAQKARWAKLKAKKG